jgi:hypothetical protein
MSSGKKLQVVNEEFNYPITGSSNYGEEATGWAEAVTEVLKEVSGPGDISTRSDILELAPLDPTDQDYSIGKIEGLLFDPLYVQKVEIKGILTREFTDSTSYIESFTIEGVLKGSVFDIQSEFVGDDTEVSFYTSSGQFYYRAKNTLIDGKTTQTLTMKFSAKALIDEEVFES